jgi:ATP-dependent Lon protease
MKDIIKQRLNEEFGKKEVTKEITAFIDSTTFKTKIEKIVKDKLKNDKELEDMMVEITKNVLTQLYKTLWTRRGFWRNDLKNKSS